MWDAGQLIHSMLSQKDISPHKLYWILYGKSAGSRRSYITRDLLSYCFRVRRYFSTKEQIRSLLPSLKRYSNFREAFPLLENPSYKLLDEEKREIFCLLNSDLPSRKLKSILKNSKRKILDRSNDRKQRISEMSQHAESFSSFRQYVRRIIKESNSAVAATVILRMSDEELMVFSSFVAAIVEEGLLVPDLEIQERWPAEFKNFATTLLGLYSSRIEDRNRFRRVVSPRQLFDVAGLISALRSEDSFRRAKVSLGVQ